MSRSENLLDIRSLTVGYVTEKGVLITVRDVDLYVGGSEGVCIVGESGSGKTTMANAILGILPSNSIILGGSINFEGVDLLRADQKLKSSILGVKINLVPQNPSTALNPIIRIEDQFCELLKYKRGIRDRKLCWETAKELLLKTGISDPDRVMKQHPHQLSGGMKQRVLIAMALSTSPKLIVADEPTSMLDATLQAQILDVLSDIKREGLSILMITHDLGVTERICERIYIMYYGEIMEFGSVEKILNKPLHPYTMLLLEHAFLGFKSSGRKETGYRDMEDLRIYKNENGCIFSSRCPYAFSRCFAEKPKILGDSSSGVKCFLY
jgi:peptide/nickel transport system ATP-binding protein